MAPNEETPLTSNGYATEYLVVDAAEASAVLAANWGWILAAGIIYVIGGIAALCFPIEATVVSLAFLVASLFVVGAIMLLGLCFAEKGHRLESGLMGGVHVLVAILIRSNAMESLLVLTFMIAVTYMSSGCYRIALAYKNRDMPGWGFTLASGVSSILLSLIITIGMPASQMYTIGILVGVNMVTGGSRGIALGVTGQQIALSERIEAGSYSNIA